MQFFDSLTCEARFANTVIAIDAIFADAIVTWVAGTIIIVYLTVRSCVDKDSENLHILTTAGKKCFSMENANENYIFRFLFHIIHIIITSSQHKIEFSQQLHLARL